MLNMMQQSFSTHTSKEASALRWLWLSALIIVLDQITKVIANTYMALHETIELAPFINLTLAYNEGAAFSFLSDAGGWQRWFFTVLAVTVSAVLVVWLRRLPPSEKFVAVALALILGGAIGNVIDRVYLGYVIDFIDVYYAQAHWPAFNVADSAISVGAVMLIWDALRGKQSAV